MGHPISDWDTRVSANDSGVVNVPSGRDLVLTNASIDSTVVDLDSRSSLELGYGVGRHGEFPLTTITLASLFKDRCASAKLNMPLGGEGKYLLTALGPNDIDVVGYYVSQSAIATTSVNHADAVESGGNEGGGDEDEEDDDDEDGRGQGKRKAEVSKTDTGKKKGVTKAKGAKSQAGSQVGSTTSTPRRPGRPSKAEVAARLKEEQRIRVEVEAAAKEAKKQEEKADKEAKKKAQSTRTRTQGNPMYDGGFLRQGGYFQATSGGPSNSSHDFLQGSSKSGGKEKARDNAPVKRR